MLMHSKFVCFLWWSGCLRVECGELAYSNTFFQSLWCPYCIHYSVFILRQKRFPHQFCLWTQGKIPLCKINLSITLIKRLLKALRAENNAKEGCFDTTHGFPGAGPTSKYMCAFGCLWSVSLRKMWPPYWWCWRRDPVSPGVVLHLAIVMILTRRT